MQTEALFEAIDTLEAVCDSQSALIGYRAFNLKEAVSAILQLPLDRREEIHGKLGRIQMILEGQMLVYQSEADRLRRTIRSTQSRQNANAEPVRKLAAVFDCSMFSTVQ